MKARLGAALWIVGPCGYLLLEMFAAAALPEYSYATNYISDLGVIGPRQQQMHVAFYLQGILFFLGATLIVGARRSGTGRLLVGLATANGVGNCLVGTVHSGQLHGLGALLAILGGNAAILAGSVVVSQRHWYRSASNCIAALGFLSFLGFAVSLTVSRSWPKGSWERGSVYSILLWQLLTACCLLLSRGELTKIRHPNH